MGCLLKKLSSGILLNNKRQKSIGKSIDIPTLRPLNDYFSVDITSCKTFGMTYREETPSNEIKY